MNATITVLPGDGIGPEVTAGAVATLRAVAERFGHHFRFVEGHLGGAAIDRTGDPLPGATLEACRSSDAVLLGAVGGPAWADRPVGTRPEDGLLRLRRELGLFANIRPVRPMAALAEASPLKAEVLEGVDMVFVRELTGGIYFGEKGTKGARAHDTCAYTEGEVERVARTAFRLAEGGGRRGRVTSIDKANVLETSRLWRAVVSRVAREEFPGVELEHMYVDAAAMHLIREPSRFDVVVTENLFGDILTDEAAALAGSIGMLPSASWRHDRFGVYEPIHGSAPDIAGRGVANPCGAILSAAMLLRHSLGLEIEARDVERAVDHAVTVGARTPDIRGPHHRGRRSTTRGVQDTIVSRIRRLDPATGELEVAPVM